MWVQTVWHWICILVFLSGLIDLLLSKNQVFYKSGFGNLSEAYHISACLKIDSTRYNCSSLEGKSLLVCKSLKSYFELVESGKLKTPQEIIKRFNQTDDPNSRLPTLFEFDHEYRISKQYSYLNLNHFCILYKLQVDQDKARKKNGLQFAFFNNFHLTLKLFLFPGRVRRYLRYEYLRCENFKSCYYFDLSLAEYRSILLPSSSDADCTNYSSKRFYFQGFEPIRSKSACLQECLKFQNRFSEFFYSENDTDPIAFNRIEHYELFDSTYSHHFAHCKGQCQKSSCIRTYFNFLGIIYKEKQNYVSVYIWPDAAPFKAILNMQSFDFWRKSLGFISLFFKISLLSLVLNVNKFLRSKIQQNSKHIFSILLVLVWVGLFSGLYYGSVLAKQIYDKYNQTEVTGYWFFEVPFVPANFSIAICEAVSRKPGKQLLTQLEAPAERFNESNFFVKFGIVERNLILSRVRHFYRSINQTSLEHCFSTNVYIKEPR